MLSEYQAICTVYQWTTALVYSSPCLIVRVVWTTSAAHRRSLLGCPRYSGCSLDRAGKLASSMIEGNSRIGDKFYESHSPQGDRAPTAIGLMQQAVVLSQLCTVPSAELK